FMVVGVAGNCRTTGLDDLAALADICRDHGVWFHVDACHGGSLIFHPGLKQRHLAGIEHADSVSLDPHKGLFTPYPSSYVVFKNRGVLNQFSRHTATVDADGSWDLGLITPFLGSRGFESLATWMMLQHIGTDQLGNIVAARQALVRYLASRLTATGLFTVLNDVDFYRVAFVFCPPRLRAAIAALPPHERRRAAAVISEHTSRLNARLYESGTVCFDEHTLADLANRTGTGVGVGVGLTVMAACPGNPLITRTDLDNAVAAVASAAADAYPALASDVFGDQEPATLGVAGPAGWSDAA
ncbi:MAG: pyridoxal phosphate-dependent decarboxylase family protein, partial [Stackebrandtia sp.]